MRQLPLGGSAWADGGTADAGGEAEGGAEGDGLGDPGELVAATATPAPASTPTVTTPAMTATRREPSQAARRPVLPGGVG
jgi:hypothetical protein